MTKKAALLPTNDAIFLYFWSLRPLLAVNDLKKITPKLSPEGQVIASKILYNTNLKYQKPIPECTDMERYESAVEDINLILSVVMLMVGGSEAVMGYLKYAGVLNASGGFSKSK